MSGIEIPAELVEAHRAGRLVLFIGAGASRDAPSDLPDFRELTRSVALEARYPASDAELDHPDVLLGRIKDSGVDVHRRVADRLGDPLSMHNRLHEAIVDVGRTSPQLRIVTTNFDRHLTSAIRARDLDVDEYVGPALPMGNDFSGLVYLHGTLGRPNHQLVVTDSDFGKAYLRDAWAARFLERMFAEFSVLFIGYSHGDVVMRYLARALGPDGHRFVLTNAPKTRDWNDLGVRPIGYEVVGDSHAELGRGVSRWALIAGMGLLDHRQRVANLVAVPPSGIPEDTSYIEDLVCDAARVRLFTELARSVDWLDWASTQPAFQDLFKPRASSPATAGALAAWFVEFYAMNEEHSGRALSIATETGGYLGPELRHEIGLYLHRNGPRPDWLGPWLVLLLRDASTADIHWLEYALVGSTWPADSAQALLMFDYLTEPTAHVARSFASDTARFQIAVRGSHHWLQEAWTKLLKPNLPHVAPALLAIADRHLRRARHLQLAASPGNRDWDELSFGRSAIEPHDQDRYPDPIDVLIDATRDGIEALLDAADPMAIGYLQSWAGSDSQVLQRIAIHGWTHRKDIDASVKIEHLVRSGWFVNHRLRHEAFRLIANALPAASDDAIDAIVDAALESEETEPDYRPYERFNALAWMDRYRPNHARITSALAEAHAVDPSWQVRPNPDLTHSLEFGVVPARPPMSVQAFHEQVGVSASDLLVALRDGAATSPWGGQPTWEDSVNLISEAVRTYPEDGHRILRLDVDADVARAVVDGWSRANLDNIAAEKVISRLLRLDDRTSIVSDVADMLSSGARSERHPTDWTAVPGARELARLFWPLSSDREAVDGEIDWLHRAINHPAGNLSEFWLHVVQHDWRADEAAWRGLVPEHRRAFAEMLSGPSGATRTKMAQVICASRLHFLFAADPTWTVENVMPLLDWSDATRAHRTWSSFVAWGRWNDHMLDAGLMPLYLETARHLDEFDEQGRDGILGHLAGIALTSSRDPLEWLPEVIVAIGDDRIRFADSVTRVLDDLPGDAVEQEWSRWMERYWENRLASVPTQLSIDEASAMAGWIPFLSRSFDAGVRLSTLHPARFREHDDVLRMLERHIVDAPEPCAALIAHLMRKTDSRWWGGYELSRLMPQLEAGGASSAVTTIREQALRLGLTLPASVTGADATATAANARPTRRKSPTTRRTASKAPAGEAAAKKTPAKKTPARKAAAAKKTPAKKTPARKAAAAKKTPAKKTPARKAPA